MEDIKEIVDSCIGNDACNFAGYRGGQPARGGNISSITNGSCVGVESCRSAAYSGFIGYIKQGCRGVQACQFAAVDRSIGGISYACNNISACGYLANGNRFGYSGVNSAVVSCCNSESECTGSIVDVSGFLLPAKEFLRLPHHLPHCLPLYRHHPPPRYVYFLMLYIICFTSNLSISNHHIYLSSTFIRAAHREPYHGVSLITTDPNAYNSIALIITFNQPKPTADSSSRSSDGKL